MAPSEVQVCCKQEAWPAVTCSYVDVEVDAKA